MIYPSLFSGYTMTMFNSHIENSANDSEEIPLAT